MIKTFKHKGLASLWNDNSTAKLDAKMVPRISRMLDALDSATRPEDLNLPGYKFHALHGFDPKRYAISVNGPWRITFSFDGGEVFAVDLEQYH